MKKRNTKSNGFQFFSGWGGQLFYQTKDGTTYFCGKNSFGQGGIGHNKNVTMPVKVSALTPGTGMELKEAALGNAHSLVVTRGNLCLSAGKNFHGQLSNPKVTKFEPCINWIEVLLEENSAKDETITGVCAGSLQTYLLTMRGTVYSCGQNLRGELGLGGEPPLPNVKKATMIEGLSKVEIVEISSGEHFVIFQAQSGSLYGCGKGENGELGLGFDKTDKLVPVEITFFKKNSISIDRVITLRETAFFITPQRKVWCTGEAKHGEFGEKKFAVSKEGRVDPVLSNALSDFQVFPTGNSMNFVVYVKRGKVMGCGFNESRLGLGGRGMSKSTLDAREVRVNELGGKRVVHVVTRLNGTFLICEDGTIFGCGRGTEGQLMRKVQKGATTFVFIGKYDLRVYRRNERAVERKRRPTREEHSMIMHELKSFDESHEKSKKQGVKGERREKAATGVKRRSPGGVPKKRSITKTSGAGKNEGNGNVSPYGRRRTKRPHRDETLVRLEKERAEKERVRKEARERMEKEEAARERREKAEASRRDKVVVHGGGSAWDTVKEKKRTLTGRGSTGVKSRNAAPKRREKEEKKVVEAEVTILDEENEKLGEIRKQLKGVLKKKIPKKEKPDEKGMSDEMKKMHEQLLKAQEENRKLKDLMQKNKEKFEESQVVEEIPMNHLEKRVLIGEGGQSTVWKGIWKKEGGNAEFAIKVIENVSSLSSQQFREFKLLWGLRYKSVLPVYGYSHSAKEKVLWIVMKLMHTSLFDYIHKKHKSKKLSMKKKLFLMNEATTCIHFLHQKNVLHNDIKSPNFLIDKHADELVVADLGLVREKTTTNSFVETEVAKGTRLWMAPELFKTKNVKYSTHSDVYALGMVFYEIVCQKIPFQDEFARGEISNLNIGVALLMEESRPIIDQSVHPELRQLIENCWKQEPHERISTGEILKELARLEKLLGNRKMINLRSATWTNQ